MFYEMGTLMFLQNYRTRSACVQCLEPVLTDHNSTHSCKLKNKISTNYPHSGRSLPIISTTFLTHYQTTNFRLFQTE